MSKISVCDPACGSGAFLLGAYQFLLDWHTTYYQKQKQDKTISAAIRAKIPLTSNEKLTTDEKKRILINNIYGVDIDAQAVEITKLSLLMQCLAVDAGLKAREKYTHLLPNIDFNIRCGNSLINNGKALQRDTVGQPFSWELSFPQIFAETLFSN